MFLMTWLLFMRCQAFVEQSIHLRDPFLGHNAKLVTAFTQILITDSTGQISAQDAKHEWEWQKAFLWGKIYFSLFLRLVFNFVGIIISSSKQSPPVAFPNFSKLSPRKSIQEGSVQLRENKVLVKVLRYPLACLLCSFLSPTLLFLNFAHGNFAFPYL